MVKKALILFAIISFLLLIITQSVSCCCFFSTSALNYRDESKPQVLNKNPENIESIDADFKIFQGGLEADYLEIGTPAVFKAVIPEGCNPDSLKFVWQIEGEEDYEGSDAEYCFKEEGLYTVRLSIRSSDSSIDCYKTVQVCRSSDQFLIIQEHAAKIGIEYILKNNGPGSLEDVTCRIENPFEFKPFQHIESSGLNEEESFEYIDSNFNKTSILNTAAVKEGEEISHKLWAEVVINEFITKSLKSNIYEDKDVFRYVKPEKFIDSDSNIIIDAAITVSENQKTQYEKAEKIYNFVINRLDYDYKRMNLNNYRIAEASEILNWDKGVCTDYAVLFAALCRAAGIPCKFVVGMSLGSHLLQKNTGYSMLHAWNEINLPGIGWIPIDPTSESPFLSRNYHLNLKTFESTDFLYQSIKIDNSSTRPIGFFYFFEKDGRPEVETECIYSAEKILGN